MASTNKTYKEGYVPGRTREVTPAEFDPNQGVPVDPIERPVVVEYSGLTQWQTLAVLETHDDGDYLSPDTFDLDPAVGSVVYLSINGQIYVSANGTADLATCPFYITNSDGTVVRPHGTCVAGDRFRWNGTLGGYEIELDDQLKISYEI